MSALCKQLDQAAPPRSGPDKICRGIPSWCFRLVRRFGRNEDGGVAMLFGLLIIPLTAFVGLAVDFGRVYSVSSHNQVALDSAALAAGRVAQVETSDVVNKASAAATTYFNQSKPKDVVSSTLEFSPNAAQTQFTVTATSWVRTPFLGALNFLFHQGSDAAAPAGCQGNHYACLKITTTSTAELKAGGNGESSLEISMVLDVTGSMSGSAGSGQTKLEALKLAAKDLIDIVVWDDQSTATSKLAIVPFADAVNVGTAAVANSVRGNLKTGSCLTSSSPCTSWTWGTPATWYKFTKASGSGSYTYKVSDRCVSERTGTNAYTDVAPSAAADKVGPVYSGTNGTTDCSLVDTSDVEINSIQPLSTDKTMLKRRIDKLDYAGSTAGHIGAAWGWYMLSPNWGSYWSSSSSAAQAYGTSQLKKIMILMTDGDYNTQFCKGARAKDSYNALINCNGTNGSSNTQAAALCTNMKASPNNVEIFTIGFMVSSSAKTRLQACATDSSHYYDASSGDALRAAFRDIALKISTLRLTH